MPGFFRDSPHFVPLLADRSINPPVCCEAKCNMEGGIEGVEELLVVDDNPADIRFIQEAFKSSSFDLTINSTTTKDEALSYIPGAGEDEETPRPDVIFLDWHLSQETGEEVLEAANSANPAIPVVVMTSSKAGVETLEESISGVEACIKKETNPDMVVDLFRSSLAEQ